jgi:DNA modification methylase
MTEFKTNSIYCGDCGEVLSHFPDKSVDLIYADPPFFSNKNYEVIWGDGCELRAFEDRWKGGIENYILWMEPKIRECHRVLKDTGSMYLHCDWHANAHLRLLMDRVFDEKNFRNEIVWKRTFAHNDPRRYGRNIDRLLFYTKTDDYTFNTVYTPYSKDYIENFFKHKDEKGKYQLVVLTGQGVSMGESDAEWHGYKPSMSGRHWSVPRRIVNKLVGSEEARKMSICERLDLLYANDYVVFSKRGIPRFKSYLDDLPGYPAQELWHDISPISSQAKERLGYPTQKPEALLERIIKASSNPTNIVLDPMCGCGTCISVSHKLERQWVGIDVSPTACKLMADRMHKLNVSIGENDIINLPRTLEELKGMKPFEFQNWACGKLYGRASEKKVGDMGIDGWLIDGRPIQVKQSENIGRNVIDNFETAIRRVKKDRGIIVAFSFGRGAYEEVARAKLEERLDIELKTVDDLT